MRRVLVFLLILLLVRNAEAQVANSGTIGLPQLPQAVPSIVFPGEQMSVVTVANGAALTTALTGVACGTTIRLTHGATYSTTTAFPISTNCGCHTGGVYNNSQWVIIESDAYIGGSVRGSRIDPSLEYGSLAHITSSDIYAFKVTANAAGCYWFLGVDVTDTNANGTALLTWGDGTFAPANYPHDVVIDHSLFQGQPTLQITSCIRFNGNWEAAVDDYISDCHTTGTDAQGIESWDGFGPFLYQNNFIEASTENTMFGGASSQPGTLVSDITITGNHYFKPLSWFKGDPSYDGLVSSVKDTIEFKNAQRVLVTGNVFDTTWFDGQHELEIFNTACSGSGPSVDYIQDVTEFYNIGRHGPEAIVFGGCLDLVNQPFHRIYFHDNLWYDIDNCHFFGCTAGLGHAVVYYSGSQAQIGPYDLWINHDTYALGSGGMIVGGFVNGTVGSPLSNFYGIQLTNSIIGYSDPNCPNGCGFLTGNGTAFGNPVITNFLLNANLTNDCVYGSGGSGTYTNPAFNNMQTPTNQATVFVSPGTDFHVAKSSVCSGAASDGLDMGANINAVNAATSGVVKTLANLHTVTNVSPVAFTHLGSTSITITGTNFISGEAQVIIGGAGPTSNISTIICAINTCTVVMSTPISLQVNDTVNIVIGSGSTTTVVQGQFTVASVTDSTHFTYTDTGVGTQSATGGTANRSSPGNLCTSPSVTSTMITCTSPVATGAVTTGPVSVFECQFGICAQFNGANYN